MKPISEAIYRQRQKEVARQMEVRGLAGLVFFDTLSQRYLAGAYFIPTERPIALVLKQEGQAALFVPYLEEEHARQVEAVDRVHSYPEYPGQRHPMQYLADLLEDLDLLGKAIGADRPGYGGFGYRGPGLSEVAEGSTIVPAGDLVETMRMTKTPEEVEFIRESARWGNLAHRLLQKYSGPGVSEVEASMRASNEATLEMLRSLGPDFTPQGSTGAHAGYRGQIGPNSALPHAVTLNAVMKPGDTLVTGASADIWGYHSELERTMFVPPVSQEQRTFFQHMLALQEIAFNAIRPGKPCSAVDEACNAYIEKHGLQKYWRHHTGHNIGLNYHEPPFLDVGDHTLLEEGMLFTVEPGLYVPGLGGFRHSDTVLVVKGGIEFITDYPRDWQSLLVGS
ncbi:MAG: Xaa-Pro peptidase family protein [Bacillota bacterium]|nr:Xaa-Pro peptidase family protein [Bacillota bacterium]